MQTLNDMWELIKEDMRASVNETVYSVWLEPLECISYENNKIVLRINEEFKRNIIMDKFSSVIRDSVQNVFGFSVDIEIVLPGEAFSPDGSDEEAAVKKNMKKKYDYTFDNFVVGQSNRFAQAAAYNVAVNLGQNNMSAYNPLFIYGHSGLGKTHLLCAIRNYLLEKQPDIKMIYTSAEFFTNELVHCISIKDTKTFHEKYRNVDILLLDDIQFISKTEKTQEEFFHTFDYLIQRGKQVVLSSDRPPKEMPNLSERLRGRFENGLLTDIVPPSLETRMAIVKLKSSELGIDLSDEIIQYIAENAKKNIRQIEGIITKLEANLTLNGVEPTIENVEAAIENIINDQPNNQLVVDNIIKEVCRVFNVTPAELKSERRLANIVLARQVAMHLVNQNSTISLQAIGNIFGGRHHTTVMHSLNEINEKLQRNVNLRATVDDIIKNLEDF